MFIAIPLAMFSCYPGGLEYYSDTDIVLTNYDDEFDFSPNKLYFMPDTIHHVVEDGKEDEVDRTHDAEIIDLVATNLEAYGYTRLVDPTKPDSILVDSANVVVTIGVVSTEYSGTGWYPGGGYWWGWYPYYGYGAGSSYYYPGYPWYGGGYYYYSYTTGSLFIEMIDEDGIDHVEEILPVVWQATINGLLSDNTANTLTRVQNTINQSFIQSPYLNN